MALAKLRAVENGQTIRDRARATLEVRTANADEPISPDPIPVSKVRRLDVDAVLARSLPKVVGE